MPTVSKKQERFMQAVAHNPAFAKKAGVPQSVGKEFTKPKGTTMPISLKKKTQSEELDEKKKEAISDSMGMKKGGMAMKKNAGFMAMMKKKAGDKPMKKMASGGMTSMGAVKTAAPSRDGIASKGKTKGTMIKMAGNSNDLKAGGMPKKMKYGGKAC
jgi:hypothetical protein